MRDRKKFEQILDMLVINQRLGGWVIAYASADIAVEHGVGESKVVFIGLSTKAVGWSFLH